MPTALEQLTLKLHDVTDLRHAGDLIEWDERVCMPEGGASVHGEMLATIRRLGHQTFTSGDVARLLDAAARELDGVPRDDDGRRLVEVTRRDYDKAVKVPDAWVAEHARVTSAAQHVWAEARAKNDFALFRPHLERIVELKREYVGFFDAAAYPYDLLLDDYEPGTTTADVRALFSALRPRQIALANAIAVRPHIDDSVLRGAYAEADLLTFSREVASAFGFDWKRGRQDMSVHPFATAIGSHDVRITTRFMERYPLSLVFGMLHETGHALYEQGVSARHVRTTLEGGTSLGIHESQSRLWENIVGRSRPFWEYFYPALQARCAPRLGSVGLDEFYRAINRVEPSFIRTEADEVTYNLHVMIRVELEITLLEGTMDVAALPQQWNQKMEEYLGVRPQSDAEGILQDIHWAAGLFGYFATYALGNVVAAQLWDRFGAVNPGRDADVRRGDFAPLLSWLRREVHEHGRKYEPQELVQRATGARVDPTPYLTYLETKYADIYDLPADAC